MQDRTEQSEHQALAAAYLIMSLILGLWSLWAAMPEHHQTTIRLRLLRSSARVTSRLARLAGAASVSHEARTGSQFYRLPYALSLARIGFERAYDQSRDVTS